MKKLISGFIATVALLLLSLNTQATHIFAVDLNYTWVHDSTYTVTLVVYGDCAAKGSTPFASLGSAKPTVCVYNGASALATLSLSIVGDTSGVEVTPVCDADTGNTQCSSTTSTIPGIKKFTYQATYTTTVRSRYLRFLFEGQMGASASAGRSSTITSISGAGTSVVFLVDTLNNTITHNTSPLLNVLPTPFFCQGRTNNYNPAATDADGDSIRFALVPAENGSAGGGGGGGGGCSAASTGTVTYNSGYSATTPITGGSFSFDPKNGQIVFTTTTTQRALGVYNVREYRKSTSTGDYYLAGTSQREMTYLVLTCSSNPPSGGISSATNGTVADSITFKTCAGGGAFSFHVIPTEEDTTNNITITSSGIPAGATFNIVNNGTNHPDGTFNWSATGLTAGSTYTFYLTFTDNACPLAGSQTFAYTITVEGPLTIPAITGNDSVCTGNTTKLANTQTGGKWSSFNAALATVDSATGLVTGVAAGYDTIYYNVTNTCGTYTARKLIKVVGAPAPPAISGADSVCPGVSVTLTATPAGGTWSNVFTSIATVNPTTGMVTGIAPGIDTIKYNYTNACGSSSSSHVIKVNGQPAAGTLTGADSVCASGTTTLTPSVTGGTWSSVFPAIATVNSSGVVTGLTTGLDTIKYSVTNVCGTATISKLVFVKPLPNAGSITGSDSVCQGSTVTFTETATGGTWSSTDVTLATVSTGGVVTALLSGLDTIKYTITNSCGNSTATHPIKILKLADAGVITSPASLCPGDTAIVTESVAGGTWTVSNTAIATIISRSATTAKVTAVANGTVNISYSVTASCGTASTFEALSVNSTPTVAAITGFDSVCLGSTTTLATTTTGGVWSTSNAAVASVNTSGLVNGVALGTAIITYKLTTTCGTAQDTALVYVVTTRSAGTITGTQSICQNTSTAFTNTTATGGVWSSNNTAVATVSNTGTVTGVAAGNALISYTVTNLCGTTVDTQAITIKALPDAGTITGSTAICVNDSSQLADAATGGVWSSANAARASVSPTGKVYARTAGTVVISYVVTNTCGTAFDTALVTNAPSVSAGTITGTPVVCQASTTSLTDAVSGGTWASTNMAVATVNTSGQVYGVAGGNAIISYTVTNGCGTATDTMLVTVNPLPNAGTVSGVNSLCLSAGTTTLTPSVSGGTWSSTVPSVATVSASGVVTALTTGTTIISYSFTNTCGTAADTQSITINTTPAVSAITGAGIVCQGANITLASTPAGGTWASSNASVATVNSTTGAVAGVAQGNAVITYTVTNGCGTGSDTALVTVNPLASPGVINGSNTVCPGSTLILSDTATGGAWSSSDNTIATVGSTGIVTGVKAGTVTISYTVTNSCGPVSAIKTVTVSSPTSAGTVTGPGSVCIGSSVTLTPSVSGGTFSATNGNASVVATSGLTGGITAGLDTIIYSLTSSCGTATTSYTITVGAPTSAGTITGPSTVCVGSNITLSNTTTSGTWSTSNTTIATINSTTGDLRGRSAGTVIVTYVLTTSCGSALDTALVTVVPAPTAGTITGPTGVCAGSTITLSNTTTGGVWSTANAAIASVNTTGTVTGVAAGTTLISYTVTNSCGTATDTATVVVTGGTGAGLISGARSICLPGTANLTETLTGGTWSSSNTGVATISTTGTVTATGVGNTIITYSATTSCGAVNDTFALSVVTTPVTPTVTGANTVCTGAFITLSSTATGGTWTTDNASAATVDASGNVTGVATGIATISYTITNACGSARDTQLVNVSVPADAGTLSGTSPLCVGATATYTSTVPGGTWRSGNAPVATISSGGVVTGKRAGFALISYTVVTGCGNAVSTKLLNVQATDAGNITGPTVVCVGSNITLSDTFASGGTWSSADATIATVNSSTGIVTGVAAGTTNISYIVSGSCGRDTAVAAITVSPAPNAGTINGVGPLCTGSTLTLTNTTASGAGTWSSSNTGVATVNTSGVVTGLSTGSSIISYTVATACATATDTALITVNSSTTAGTVTGGPNICVGNTATYTTTATGGTWSSSNSAVATVSTTGVVTGVAAGTASISYSVAGACGTVSASAPVNVSTPPTAGTLTGPSTICVGSVSAITPGVSGGTWSVASPSILTVNTSGVMTGLSAGSTTVTYTVTNSCSSAFTTLNVTVSPISSPGTLTGASGVCVGASTVFSPSASGGTWTTANSAVASVDGFGIVYGVSAGSTIISYSITGSCGTVSATKSITVSNAPATATLTGGGTICAGASATITASAGGGTWSSSDATVATVSNAGVVTGVNAGTATISYTTSTACSTLVATAPVTVNPAADAGVISGTSTVCIGTPATLTETVSGGTWSSSNASVATISTGGVVTGVATGSATISYITSNSCGLDTAIFPISVGTAPTAGTISGSAAVCIGSAVTLASTGTGGTWSSSNTSVASVSATGIVYGVSAGFADISYTVSGSCGSVSATYRVAVNAFPNAGVINGPSALCIGYPVTYTDTMPGGIWSSGNTALATVSNTGIVTGLSGGTVNIYYSVTNACGATNVTISVTVRTSPGAGSILGRTSICPADTAVLSGTISGGSWAIANASIATVSASGILTGITSGTTTVSYLTTSTCGTSYATRTVTVGSATGTGTITAPATLCAGATATLTETVSGGTWSSGNPSVATVSSGGIVTGISAGTATISYTVTGTCGAASATTSLTVTPGTNAGTINGLSSVCVGLSAILTDSVSGGTWSSSNPSVASVSSSGVVTGVSTGAATISYTVTGSTCGAASATKAITVTTTPNEGFITGPTSLCQSASATLTESVTGGVWSSANTGIATVSTTGTVTGVSGGSVIISYTVTNACGFAVATAFMTINPLPSAGAITGPKTICVGGGATTYTTGISGGTWSISDASVATITSSGVVTPVATGTTVIGYSVSNTCGTANIYDTISVNLTPASAGTLSGTTILCPGNTAAFSTTATGGTWSSTDTTVIKISSTGVATAVNTGTAVIAYTISNACGTAMADTTITVNPGARPSMITGSATLLCIGSTGTLTDSVAGGTWTSGNTSVATISSTGVVTALAAGTSTISYSISNSCGTGMATVDVNVVAAPTVGAIAGRTSLCTGTATTLTNPVPGGVWASSNTAVATINPTTGTLTGVSAGTTIVSYTVTSVYGCIATATYFDTVLTSPTAGTITAPTTVLCAGSMLALTDTITGGIWSSSNTSVATVDGAGMVTGTGAGTVAISYTVTNVCGSSATGISLNVLAAPVLSAIGGSPSQCAGTTATFTDSHFGGVWTSSNTAVATINRTTGVLNALAAGITTITYTDTNALGCGSTVTLTDTVLALPDAGVIDAAGGTTVCAGATLTLADTAGGGTGTGAGGMWLSANPAIAGVDGTGEVDGAGAGATDIYYITTNRCGSDTASVGITVNPAPAIGPVIGSSPLCSGTTTVFSNTAFGGVWTSSDSVIASVNPSTGAVRANAAGTVTISYTVTNVFGCMSRSTMPVSVIPGADVGAITAATTTLCTGQMIAFSDTAGGGTGTAGGGTGTAAGVWTSSDTTIATISATGMVTAVNPGSATITYSVTAASGCTAQVTAGVTVNLSPAVAGITGATSLCTGTTIILSNSTTGGTWSATDTTITVDAIGNVTGISAGLGTTSYSVTSALGCTTTVTYTDTVSDLPALSAIGGSLSVCTGSTTTLTDTAGGGTGTTSSTGGTWTSGNTSVATIDPASGTATGVSSGTAVISYTKAASAGCVATQTATLTVNATPTVSAITGTTTLCAGDSSLLTSTTAGGVWTSSNATVATINGASGRITALSAGTDTVTYTVTGAGGCTGTATAVVTVHGFGAGSISGRTALCTGTTATLTAAADTASGGTSTITASKWVSSNPAVATVDSTSGIVTAIAAGTTNITYTATSSYGCTGTAAVTVTVSAPTAVAAISGSARLCAGGSTAYTNDTTGGMWSSNDTTIASINPATGTLSALRSGALTISYSVPNAGGCVTTVTKIITIDALPTVAAISGSAGICTGSTAMYSDATSGGVWSSSNTAVASISTSGVAYGVSAGTATLSYSVTGSTTGCTGTATTTVTVSARPVAGAITGAPARLCAGASVILTDTATGGMWTSSDTTIAKVSGTGAVSAVKGGTATIIYTVGVSGCSSSASAAITVDTLPATPAITGTTGGLCTGTATTLAGSAAGGMWSSSDTTIININPATGAATGRRSGMATVSYTVTSAAGCTATGTRTLTVSDAPSGILSPSGSVTLCSGATPISVTLTGTTTATAYQWYRGTTAIAGATSSTVLADSVGYYTVAVSNGGCTVRISGVSAVAPPTPVIGKGAGDVLYTGSYSSYQWYRNGIAITGATTSTYNPGSTPGAYTVQVTDGNGCSRRSAAYIIDESNAVQNVNGGSVAISVKWYPNPATDNITVEADGNRQVQVTVYSADGRQLLSQGNATAIDVSSLSSGIYLISITDPQSGVLLTAGRFMKQ